LGEERREKKRDSNHEIYYCCDIGVVPTPAPSLLEITEYIYCGLIYTPLEFDYESV